MCAQSGRACANRGWQGFSNFRWSQPALLPTSSMASSLSTRFMPVRLTCFSANSRPSPANIQGSNIHACRGYGCGMPQLCCQACWYWGSIVWVAR